MGRSAMLKEPSFLVCAFNARFVAVERAFTLAPGSTAPLLSVTLPFIEPSVCWAEAAGEQRARPIMPIRRTRRDSERHTKAERREGRMAELPLLFQRLIAK